MVAAYSRLNSSKEDLTQALTQEQEISKQYSDKIELLEKQIAEEVKEKYSLYKRIKELTEEINALKNKSPEMSTISGPDEIQRYRT